MRIQRKDRRISLRLLMVSLFYTLAGMLALALTACAGNGGSPAPDRDAPLAAPVIDSLAALPRPSELRIPSYMAGDLFRYGAEHLVPPACPTGKTTEFGSRCDFSPNWVPGAKGDMELAYAGYVFNLQAQAPPEKIDMSWLVQGESRDLWIGLVNYGRDCWRWYQPGADCAELLTDFTSHVEPESGEMLVMVVCTGTAPWQLEWINVGPAVTQDFYAIDGYVFAADGVTPIPDVPVIASHNQAFYEVVTDATGYWAVGQAVEADYVIRPSLAPWVFTPATREVTVAGADVHVEPFLGEELPAFKVDGQVYLTGTTSPLPGIEVYFTSDTIEYMVWTDMSGYSIMLPAGDWVVHPESADWLFDPVSQELPLQGEAHTMDVFYATSDS